MNKIVSIEEIVSLSERLKQEGKKVVQCHGVFDLLHPGHLKHFEAAKKFGDILIVSITEDKNVNKGPGRPIFTQNLRAENIAALTIVDYVIINNNPLAVSAIEAIKPDFYVKGQDYKKASEDITGGILVEKNKVTQFGGKLVFTEEIQFSSSKLINRHLDVENKKLKEYFKNARKRISFEKLKSDFEDIAKFKVLVIGDIILDEYQFVSTLGKSSKSATITTKRLNDELYVGGVLAVANHISDFVEKVDLLSVYGDNFGTNYYDFIKENLHHRANFLGIHTTDRPTVLKKRFIDKTFKQKFFEIIEIEDKPLSRNIKQQFIEQIDRCAIQDYDMIVVADFGHGLIDKEIASHLTQKNIFLSVNTQTNSANEGFNLLTKYPRCDYFSIDKKEAQLACQDKYVDIKDQTKELIQRMQSKVGAVTLGVDGSLVGNFNEEFLCNTPAMSQSVVDTIGAGDAFLSITALLAKNGNAKHEIGFVGNAVGAMAVQILGNKSFIKKAPLLKYLNTLLK